MPSSAPAIISPLLQEIINISPTSILDVGIGYGKLGFLSREFLESWRQRVFPKQWVLQIDGIEVFPSYVQEFTWLQTFYDNIYLGDACAVITDLKKYDIVVSVDMVEHVEKAKGIQLVKDCIAHSTKACIISVPIGSEWLRAGGGHINPHEQHKASWSIQDLRDLAVNVKSLHFTEWAIKDGRKGCIATYRK